MYSLAHAGVFAGTVGMPMVSTIFWALSFLGDEDEPDDLERWIYRNAVSYTHLTLPTNREV